MSQTCPYCRESIVETDLAECPACHTPHHQDCWMENGGCTVFGCEHAPADDPKIAVSSHEMARASIPASGYFVSRDGQQYGPYTLDALREETFRGTVSRTDLVWAEGLPNWVQLSQVLAPPQAAPPPLPPPPIYTAYPAYSSPGTGSAELDDPCAGRMHFGRALYFLSLVAALIILGALANFPETESIASLVFLLLWLPAAVLRARDVGMSGWTVLLLFVPILNLFVTFRLLLAPRGYAITKQADSYLRIMTWIFVGIVVLGLISILLSALTS
jgi:uncharacterized membrane protein YhaH (DUF805 family)